MLSYKLKKKIEDLIDKTDDKIMDIISIGMLSIGLIWALFVFISSLTIFKDIIIARNSMVLYSLAFVLTIGAFYVSMLGKELGRPVNRPKVFLAMTIILTINTYALLAEILNYTGTLIIDSLLKVTDVPAFLIHTNIRFATVFIPVLIVALVFNKALAIPFNKLYKKELLEYTVAIFTRNVDKLTDTSIDITVCEDIETGEPIIVPERIGYRHTLVSGSSGSGKTALYIRPVLAQLFNKKAMFRENLKRLTFEALEEGLCYINKPITRKYINENFTMDLITVYPEKKEQFVEKMKDYIIGVRDRHVNIHRSVGRYFYGETEEVKVDYKLADKGDKIEIKVNAYLNGMIKDSYSIWFNEDGENVIVNDDYIINIEKESFIDDIELEEYETNEDGENVISNDGDSINIEKESFRDEDTGNTLKNNEGYETLVVKFVKKNSEASLLELEIEINQIGDGKIIYKDLGVFVVAPDGGLAGDTIEIAEKSGVKVHKIDPKMQEIEMGNVAKFNPLLVGNPEKAGDIISSILVKMEQSSGKDANAYFTNASIRAVRNVVILLRVMYPRLNNNANPTLSDVLDLLNNFNLVVPYVEALKMDSILSIRYKTVIDYFFTCFYAPLLDGNGKPLPGGTQGSKRNKTEEAISGCINQLDNFLGREEIKYILCNREEGIDLSKILENGECVAVATRQSELGEVLGKAFALMIILSLQNAVLCRYSEDENPEVPVHIFIDEFPFYINDSTKVFFTFSRKYKANVTVAIQNMAQLAEDSPIFKEVIFTNCATKLVLPGANVEDREYFCKFFGIEEVFEKMTSVSSNPIVTENAKYSESIRGSLMDKNKVSEQEIAEMEFKRCYYATINSKGKNVIGKGYMDFVKLTEENTTPIEYYEFDRFNSTSSQEYTIKETHSITNSTKRIEDNAATILATVSNNTIADVTEDETNQSREAKLAAELSVLNLVVDNDEMNSAINNFDVNEYEEHEYITEDVTYEVSEDSTEEVSCEVTTNATEVSTPNTPIKNDIIENELLGLVEVQESSVVNDTNARVLNKNTESKNINNSNKSENNRIVFDSDGDVDFSTLELIHGEINE